jgi:PAS domain S-box-containing protein
MNDISQKDSNYKVGRILVVDDEAELMSALCEMLVGQGYEAAGFLTGAEALAVLQKREFDLLLTDLMMPGMDGIELIRAGLEIDPNLIGIIMTGHGTVQTAVEAMKSGAFDYILKPFKLNAVLPLLSRAMQVRNLRLENMQLKETVAIHELGKAIAFSSDLNSILNKIADAALQQCSADEVSIMLPTKNGRELYVAVVRGGRTENLGEHVPIEQGIAGWVARNRESVVFRGDVDDPRMAPIRPRNDIYISVSMPLISQSKIVGVLNVNITKSHRQFTLGQLKALSILVSIIAPILENASLNIKIREGEEKYRSIFENATEGIYQTTPEGRFIAANAAMATLLGYDSPEELISAVTDIAGRLYVDPEDRTRLIRMIEECGTVKKYETRFYRKDGRTIWMSVNIRAAYDKNGEFLHYDAIAGDITERKLAEQQQALTGRILETLNRPNEIVNLIRDILLLLKEYTGVEAIGIRLRKGDDFPYFETKGFPQHFLEAERYLCVRDGSGEIVRDSDGNPCLECMCGNILCGRTDPTHPFFTEGGSFWTNSTTGLLAATSEEDRQARTRNRCNSEGYESVALIPLRSSDEIIGLLQLNDSRRDLFSIEAVRFFERIGATVGIAVGRMRSVEALRESDAQFKEIFDHAPVGYHELDTEGRITRVNQTELAMLGYSAEEMLGRCVWEFIDEGEISRESVLAKLAGALPPARNLERIYRRKDGTKMPVLIQELHLRDRDGKVAGIRTTLQDMTEQKQAEEWLLRERSMVDRIMKTSPAGITVVDREGRIVFANRRAEEIFCLRKEEIIGRGYGVSEWNIKDLDGAPFPVEQLPHNRVMTAGNPVYGVRHTIDMADGKKAFLSVNAAPIFEESGDIGEVILTIDDITQYMQAEEKIKQSVKQLEKSMEDTIKAMATIVETKDAYTAGHQGKVTRLAAAIAEKMNLPEALLKGIHMAGSIHDIGKLSIPAEILSKPGRLSEMELGLIRTHPQAGYDIMKDVEFPWPVARIILEHHERMDGSGYPNGRSRDDILLEARIIAVADVVDAIASHRPYRPSLGIEMALSEIETNKGVLYDPDVVDACLKLFREEGFQSKEV